MDDRLDVCVCAHERAMHDACGVCCARDVYHPKYPCACGEFRILVTAEDERDIESGNAAKADIDANNRRTG